MLTSEQEQSVQNWGVKWTREDFANIIQVSLPTITKYSKDYDESKEIKN